MSEEKMRERDNVEWENRLQKLHQYDDEEEKKSGWKQ